MKIAIVTRGSLPIPNVKGGGVETLISALMNENEKSENKMVVYSIYNEEAALRSEEYVNTEMVYLPKQERTIIDRVRARVLGDFPREAPMSYTKIADNIEKENFDRIVLENASWQFYFFVKRFGNKVYLHLHNDWINNTWGETYKEKFRYAINHCGGVIVVSKFLKERVETLKKVNQDKIRVLYNATDIKMFSKEISQKEKAELRKKLNIKGKEKLIIYTGRICEDKGVLELLESFTNMCDKYSDVKLLIVGSVSYGETTTDKYTMKVHDIVNQYSERIITTGFVPYQEMYKYYSIADIQVIPSMWEEPFGLVAIEGMAQGLPIIATDSGGLNEILNENNSIVIKRNNIIKELEYAMERLCDNESLCNIIKINAMDTIKKHKEYSYEEYYKLFINLLLH